MKLKLFFFLLFAGIVSFTFSQDCKMFYPIEEGTEIEITNYDKKDNVSGTSIQKITSKEEDGENITLGIYQETHDDKGELLGSGEFEIRCEGGTFYVDMRSYLDDKAMSAYEGMEIAVEASDMEMPNDMNIGQALPDASITAVISNQGIKMLTMTINITNRKVEAIEDVTTPAGTFECYKLTYDINTKMMIKIEGHAVEWLSEDVGMVRSESYSKKGKLQGYSVLTGLKN
jgi:hypothetical protein